MKITKYIAIVILLILSSNAMAQQGEDGWLKRHWNDMIAHFNIYFNAEQKLLRSVDELAERHRDNFEDYLSLYPYGTEKDAKNQRANLEEVMKKASKVIQHKPRSKWVDDSYFTIGLTHFYGGDYFAAIEAFQFVNANFTDPDIKAMSQLYLMKSYIQQGKYDDAEAIFGYLKEQPSTLREFRTHLNLSGGDLMVKQGKLNEAIPLLTKGVKSVKDRRLRYRTHFLLGQLYLNNKKYDEANRHFIRVLKLNAPYQYVFQANLGMARSTAQSGGKGAKNTSKYLNRMLDDDKNIEYFDQLYYELGLLQFGMGDEQEGLRSMMNSSKYAGKNNTQRTKTYLYLGDYYFTARNYDKAQAYYDSAVSYLPEEFPDADKIRAQHSVLSELIENVATIQVQDSLLALSRLPRKDLDELITSIIEEEKERALREKEEEELRRERDRISGGAPPPTLPGAQTGNTWYFYNPAAVAQGENEFIRLWGNRKPGDFWRFINKSAVEDAIVKDKKDEAEADPDTYVPSTDEKQNEVLAGLDKDRRKYYEPIPFSDLAKDVAEKKIQDAFMSIGKIYFDDLKEFRKTITNLDTLLRRYPRTKHRPEALFYMARSSENLGDSMNYDRYAKMVANEFPETPYNQVLNAKEIVEDSRDEEAIALYHKMYQAYSQEQYDEVFEVKAAIDKDYPGSSIQAKVDYLYALTIGKTKGKDEFLAELKILQETYTGTEIGEIARYTLSLFETSDSTATEVDLTESKFVKATRKSTKYYYVVSGVSIRETDVQLALSDYNSKYFNRFTLQVSSFKLDTRDLFYMKQFNSTDDAMRYHNEMKDNRSIIENAGLSEMKGYVISDENFRILFRDKNEKEYISFFKANF